MFQSIKKFTKRSEPPTIKYTIGFGIISGFQYGTKVSHTIRTDIDFQQVIDIHMKHFHKIVDPSKTVRIDNFIANDDDFAAEHRIRISITHPTNDKLTQHFTYHTHEEKEYTRVIVTVEDAKDEIDLL